MLTPFDGEKQFLKRENDSDHTIKFLYWKLVFLKKEGSRSCRFPSFFKNVPVLIKR